jgi:D-glycero-alpha-D-manno-heptose 1-phosphate guanylyltransferase
LWAAFFCTLFALLPLLPEFSDICRRMECIILAGGLGTRLRGVIGDQPKCMAPVRNKPFLEYLLDYLELEGCTRLILSLGYKHEIITEWLTTQSRPFEITCVIEEEPLGTGGGIHLALQKAVSQDVFILNGDTMFRVSLKELLAHHHQHQAETTLALKTMQQFERYGVVRVNAQSVVTAFEEKKYYDAGTINGGIYCINRERFLARKFASQFSFEKDYLEQYVHEGVFYGFTQDTYFIDIGVPADYERVQTTL